jgi:hypothetical protein
MSMSSKEFASKVVIFLSVMSLIAILAPLSAASGEDSEVCRRDYRIVNLGDDSHDSANRRLFEIDSFSSWICEKNWKGREIVSMRQHNNTKDGHQVNWHYVMDRKDFKLIEVSEKIIGKDGKTIKEELVTYENHYYKYPDPTLHVSALPAFFPRQKIQPGWKKTVNLLVAPEMAPWEVVLLVDGLEKVKVPAGEFQTYRVKMEFNYETMMGKKWGRAVKLMSSFMPEYYYWVEKKAPHHVVKFQGAMGPPFATPEQAIELTKVHAPAKNPTD